MHCTSLLCILYTHTPGANPVEAVTIMSKIALEAEAAIFHPYRFNELRRLTSKPTTTLQTTAIAAVEASFLQNAAAIITLTTSGRLYITYVEKIFSTVAKTCS